MKVFSSEYGFRQSCLWELCCLQGDERTMSDLVIFGFGALVTLICSGAVGLLLLGAYQDGQATRERKERANT